MKKLLMLSLLLGISQNTWGQLVELPRNAAFFKDSFAGDLELDLGIFKDKVDTNSLTQSMSSFYIKTNQDGKISAINISPVVASILFSLKTKHIQETNDLQNNFKVQAEQIVELERIKTYCETNHKDFEQKTNAYETLRKQTFWQRHSRINTFLSFSLGTAFGAAIMTKLYLNTIGPVFKA